jgi:DNA polymerase-3 subunit gamma/tau
MLNIKYRPRIFKEIIGNQGIIKSLNSLLKQNKFPHSILLTGETGCGKSTFGRIIARKLGSKGIDFVEIDTADFRGIETIRTIRSQIGYSPSESKSRVWLLDECHGLSKDAQNALLKVLEEAPEHVYFVLCTTDPQKLLPTIKGRCTQFQVNLLKDEEIKILIEKISKKEKKEINEDIIEKIVELSEGHPRNALKLLEKVLYLPENEKVENILGEKEIEVQTIELCRLLMKGGNWKSITKILKEIQNEDPEGIRRLVLGYCNSILLKADNSKAFLVMEAFEENFYNTGKAGLTIACYRIIKS